MDRTHLPESSLPIRVFVTCPHLHDSSVDGYLRAVARTVRAADEQRCTGVVIHSDNRQLDPWTIAQVVVQESVALEPVVTVQPVYMHPYAVAKRVATLSALYTRRLGLNIVAGGFRDDLLSLGDSTTHDPRYERLIEYGLIVRGLLDGDDALTFEGRFHRVDHLRVTPPVPEALRPSWFVPATSDAGRRAALALSATPVCVPPLLPEPDFDEATSAIAPAVRLGVVARETTSEAWENAMRRFPADRTRQVEHRLDMVLSDSSWHRDLTHRAEEEPDAAGPYWLHPFRNRLSPVPFLVGDHRQVSREIARLVEAGCGTFLLDTPASADDLRHTRAALERGWSLATTHLRISTPDAAVARTASC